MPIPNGSAYPTALDSSATLFADPANQISTTLAVGIGSGDGSFVLTDAVAITAPTFLAFATGEIVYVGVYTIGTKTCSSVIRGSVSTSHNASEVIKQVLVADYFRQYKAAIIAIETALGLSPQGSFASVLARFNSHTHDGTGSNGVVVANSDKLDGNHGSYYTPLGQLTLTGAALTIASDAVTVAPATPQGFYTIDTEAAATADNLSTINGGLTGSVISITALSSSHNVIVKHNVGNIMLPENTDLLLTTTHAIDLRFDGAKWYVLGRAGNANNFLVYNNSGVILNQGDVVILDKSYTSGLGVTLTTLQNDRRAIGVVTSPAIPVGSTGYIAKDGIALVNVTGAVAFGRVLIPSTTLHYAIDSGGGAAAGVQGAIAFSLGTNVAGNGQVSAMLISPSAQAIFSAAAPAVEGTLDGAGSLPCGSNVNRGVIAICIGSATGGSPAMAVNAAPTVGGVSMTLLGNYQPTTTMCMAIYGLVGNGTGNQTTVAATWTGGTYLQGITYFVSLSGVLQSSCNTVMQTAGGVSTSNPSIADAVVVVPDLVISAMFKSDANTDTTALLTGYGSGWTQRTKNVYSNVGENGIYEVDTKPSVATSETDTWASSASRTWYMVSISIHSA